ncbi:MAG: hypothetical protein ACLVJH_01820 [Faecalibacterium prausnitzii]
MAQFRSKPFGVTKNGDKVDEYIISNPGGLEVSVLNYGCVIKNLFVPTKTGPVDVVVGRRHLADYEADFNLIRQHLLLRVRSWAGTPTALKMRNFLSAARPTSWKPTMAKITCTAPSPAKFTM